MIALVLRAAGALAGVALIVFLSYNWGSQARKAEYEAAIGKIRAEHAQVVASAMGAVTDRALSRQKKDLDNEGKQNDAVAADRAVEGSDSVCVRPDILDRLRELQ